MNYEQAFHQNLKERLKHNLETEKIENRHRSRIYYYITDKLMKFSKSYCDLQI